jgi:hypothetical protein
MLENDDGRIMKKLLNILIGCLLLLVCYGCHGNTGFIFSTNTEIDSPDGLSDHLDYEDIWIQTSDGLRLHAWYVEGDADKPIVLFFHGNAANITHRWPNVMNLSNQGYSVFIFDYRGFGQSEGRANGEVDLHNDSLAALQYLKQRNWQPNQIIYYGRSMGAAVALQLAVKIPPAGLVLEAPFTSLREEARFHSPLLYCLFHWWLADEFNNLKRIPQLKTPLLLIHGDADEVVPFSMSQRLFILASEPKQFLAVPGADHSNCYQIGHPFYQHQWQNFTNRALRREL